MHKKLVKLRSAIKKFGEYDHSCQPKQVPKIKPFEMYSPNPPLIAHVGFAHVM